jgi:hypothetical protein
MSGSYDIKTSILKNNGTEIINIDDLGISIPPGEEVVLSDLFSTTEIINSEDLKKLIFENNDISVSDGTRVLSKEEAYTYESQLAPDPSAPLFNAIRFNSTYISLSPPEDLQTFVFSSITNKFELISLPDIPEFNANRPIWNANKIYNIPVDISQPDDGDFLQYNSTLNIWTHTGPIVFPLIFTETDLSKSDWVNITSDINDSEIGHVLPFDAKIKEASIWCKQVTNGGQTLKLYIEDTVILDPLFTLSNSNNPQVNKINNLNIPVTNQQRIRVRAGSGNGSIKRLYLNLTIERV